MAAAAMATAVATTHRCQVLETHPQNGCASSGNANMALGHPADMILLDGRALSMPARAPCQRHSESHKAFQLAQRCCEEPVATQQRARMS